MNHSIYSADRATHSKIVIVALLVAAAISGFAVSLHFDERATSVERVAVSKPGRPVAMSGTTIVAAR
ncbi:hypothetical protein [Bradyrhizobium guangxiense]|uniref:hypothetical protein n=1 Tax=Bradyrhizobium guangxiense TaxID=1325115 RepID=UPI001008BC7B|nr:hypothetical protein [Bradyrhizobium guangxiense]